MVFNEQLICRRKQLGLSQEQLGDRIGVTRQTVSKWELGETTPDMDKLIQLSDLFGVSIDELVGKDDSQNKQEAMCLAQQYTGRYEYKSKRTFRGIPLVHICIGRGICRAKGIIAIGTIAQGAVAIGLLSMGLVSIGCVGIGLIAIGCLALGILAGFGSIATGIFAFGGIAVGIVAFGGLAYGQYSLGGCAIASKIAKGGYASAKIAIGDKADGDIIFDIHKNGQSEAIKNAIITEFPNTWRFIVNLFS